LGGEAIEDSKGAFVQVCDRYLTQRNHTKDFEMFKQFTRHTFLARLSAATLLSFCLLQTPVHTQETTERVLMTAPFGLAADQGLRFNLFVQDCTIGSAHVRVFDGRSETVAESPDVRISAGEFHSFNFDPGDIHLASEENTGRREVRASCWVRVDSPWARVEGIAATLEIIQVSTGITDGLSNTIFVGERPPILGNNTLDLHDFVIGQVSDQSLRLNAFIVPESSDNIEPVRMHAKAYDKNNNIIAVSRPIEILPGHFGEIRFNYTDLGTEGESGTGRKQVRIKPFFEFRSDRLVSGLASYELVDDNIGSSRIYIGIHFRHDSQDF
jgi:hypothetical protein